MSGLLGDRGQLPSEEQSNVGGGEDLIRGSRRTGPQDRNNNNNNNRNTFYWTHSGERIHKDTELERPREDGKTTGKKVKEKGAYGY